MFHENNIYNLNEQTIYHLIYYRSIIHKKLSYDLEFFHNW